jgi:hypothetical protein
MAGDDPDRLRALADYVERPDTDTVFKSWGAEYPERMQRLNKEWNTAHPEYAAEYARQRRIRALL